METSNTINIVQNLKGKHIGEFKKYVREQERKIAKQKTIKNKQLTLETTEDCMRIWIPSDPRA